jgi:hypothetical protein
MFHDPRKSVPHRRDYDQMHDYVTLVLTNPKQYTINPLQLKRKDLQFAYQRIHQGYQG